MTAPPAPRPEDVYNAATIAGFRSAGYWRDDSLSAAVDRLAGARANHPIYRHDEVRYVLPHSGAKVAVVAGGVPRL